LHCASNKFSFSYLEVKWFRALLFIPCLSEHTHKGDLIVKTAHTEIVWYSARDYPGWDALYVALRLAAAVPNAAAWVTISG